MMTTFKVNIDNEKDLSVLQEILTRFGLNYSIDNITASVNDKKMHKRLTKSFKEIKDWESGRMTLQNAKAAILEIDKELGN